MSGMYFGVTALEGKIGATQRVTGRWNMNCLLTQLCELRPKTHAICAELFVAGNFVTKKKKNQQNANRDGIYKMLWHSASFLTLGFNLCCILFPLPLLIFLWKSPSDTQLFIVSFLGYQWLSVFHLQVSGVKQNISVLLFCIDRGLELGIVLLSPEKHCILFSQ